MNRHIEKPGRHHAVIAVLARSRPAAGVALLPFLLIWVLPPTIGCRDSADSAATKMQSLDTTGEWHEEYFQYAVSNLQRLEEFGGGEMRQEIVDRLNQWVRTQKLPADWKLDPMAATLPKPLAELPEVRSLDGLEFLRDDGFALQEAVWLRDASNAARGKQLEDLARARRLFDWVARNVQLEPGSATEPEDIANRPWETLLFGRGTVTDRAWVFVLLARQQGIDAVVLALPSEEDSTKGQLENWAVGILDEGKLYLFDPRLGLPIPAPGGVKFDEDGQLDVQPATLEQVTKDPSLLRQLDLDASHPYPVTAERLNKVVALVEASPAYLAARMKLVESRLAGKQKVVLTANPSALAKRLEAVPGLAETRLWLWPYQVMLKRSRLSPEAEAKVKTAMLPFRVGKYNQLWKGRLLHLKGELTGPKCATYYYQEARLSDRRLVVMRDEIKSTTDPKDVAKMKDIYQATLTGKADASYWLGLVECALGNFPAAADYFVLRTLNDSPGGPWTTGAIYNLGRTFESAGQRDKAIEVYRADTTSPAYFGNLLRARWLQPPPPKVSLPGAETPAPPEQKKPDEKKTNDNKAEASAPEVEKK
ncbi:MAG: hypothetical protein NTW96_15875 [Planctomycetia bacterium]|nr:hypothetical protein [Planctomycetia bacterium]